MSPPHSSDDTARGATRNGMRRVTVRRLVVLVVMLAALASASMLAVAQRAPLAAAARQASSPAKSAATSRAPRHAAAVDRRTGLASYYAHRFAGRPMADGTPMRPDSDNAASRTLPLGTVARVTNLRNGRSALVTIRDRGPYTRGRILDVSPATARLLGFVRQGITHVEVLPLHLPPADETLLATTGLEPADPDRATR